MVLSVDFNKKTTLALILQACLEVGPDTGIAGSILRDAHADTQQVAFMTRITRALNDALGRIRESWQNGTAICLLACLATRLCLSPSHSISDMLLEYHVQLRTVSIGWARMLLQKVNRSEADQERQEWMQRILMTALICVVTFNVGEAHLRLVLSDSQSLATLVESDVLARTYLPASGRPADPVALQLMYRWHTVMYQARDIVADEVINKEMEDWATPSSSSGQTTRRPT